MINQSKINRINELASKYKMLANENPEAIYQIAMTEIPEMVYNSNAIENSTLSLKDTEDILLRDKLRKDNDVREIFEAKNLGRITELLINEYADRKLNKQLILNLHKILLNGISDNWAGRFRSGKEWVRIVNHVGANPDYVEKYIDDLIKQYYSKSKLYFLNKIAQFHLEFEIIHPFNDGNGRIGRVIINKQLLDLGLPPIIIQNKSKNTEYYPAFEQYLKEQKYDLFLDLISGLLIESLHRRITILTSEKIIRLSEWAKLNNVPGSIAVNKAKRGTIPAFRLSGKWMISKQYKFTE